MIGVIGRSILKEKHLEAMILQGRQKMMYFISGSTKTVEFADLEVYLQSLRDEANPQIGGIPVKVDFSALRDLQTGILQGYRVNLSVGDDQGKRQDIVLVGRTDADKFSLLRHPPGDRGRGYGAAVHPFLRCRTTTAIDGETPSADHGH